MMKAIMAGTSCLHAQPMDHNFSPVWMAIAQPCPRCGSRRRWRGVIRKDLKEMETDESKWYEEI